MVVHVGYYEEACNATTWRDVVSEVLGTFFLVSIQCALPLSWGTQSMGNVVQIALGMGFVVIALNETFGEFGGAHMNPAVTISMIAGRKISILKGLIYIISQCAGATAGAGFVYGVTPPEDRAGMATFRVNPKLHPVVGMAVEAWLTAILIFTIWGSSNKRRKSVLVPSLPTGLAVALGVMAGSMYTGSSMNPARSLGPAIMMGVWENHWVYWAGPIMGGLAATITYHYLLDKMEKKELLKADGYKAIKTETKIYRNKCRCSNNTTQRQKETYSTL